MHTKQKEVSVNMSSGPNFTVKVVPVGREFHPVLSVGHMNYALTRMWL